MWKYFSDIMGYFVEPEEVFVAFTVDQGGNVVNTCEALGVNVIWWNRYRVNSATLWSLGISGKTMCELMKKIAMCVGVSIYSAVNDKLEYI